MTTQTTETVQAAASVDEAFWELVLADPELAAAEFAELTEPDFPPPDAPPPADGRPGPSPGPDGRSAPPPDRPPTSDHRTVPPLPAGTVRSPPLRTKSRATGAGRRRS